MFSSGMIILMDHFCSGFVQEDSQDRTQTIHLSWGNSFETHVQLHSKLHLRFPPFRIHSAWRLLWWNYITTKEVVYPWKCWIQPLETCWNMLMQFKAPDLPLKWLILVAIWGIKSVGLCNCVNVHCPDCQGCFLRTAQSCWEESLK